MEIADKNRRLKSLELLQAVNEADAAYLAKPEGKDQAEKAAFDEIYACYEQNGILLEDEDGNALVCAASGVPVFADDEYLEDLETGEIVLRSFVLPPRVASLEAAE